MALTWSRGKGEGKTEKDSRDSKPTTWRRGDLNTRLPQPDRSGLQQPAVQTQSTAEFLFSTRSLCCDAATSTKFRSAVLEAPGNPGRCPVLRKPPKHLAREDSRLHAVALDAARRPSPPRPQRGPRRRRRPSLPSVPRPTPVPPRLGVFNRRPPPWFCGANQETRLPSLLASLIQEWTPQLPPGPSSSTATHRRHLTPVYLQSKDQAYDHTARLTIHCLGSDDGYGIRFQNVRAKNFAIIFFVHHLILLFFYLSVVVICASE